MFIFERWQVADKWRFQGRGPPPLIFRPNWGLKEDRPPPISGSGWPGAPYLKVWTPHWFFPLEHSLSSLGLEANHLIPELSWEKWALGWSWFNSGPYLGDPRLFSRQAYRLLTFFSISCKRDFYSLIFVQESSIPKHCVRSYCLFTNVLFNFELMFLSNRLTVSCHPKPPP